MGLNYNVCLAGFPASDGTPGVTLLRVRQNKGCLYGGIDGIQEI